VKRWEAAYLGQELFYVVPIYSLDQTDIKRLITGFYRHLSNSEYLSEANETVRVYRKEREKKKIRIQYNIRFQVSVSL
jgi:hypothetical protein